MYNDWPTTAVVLSTTSGHCSPAATTSQQNAGMRATSPAEPADRSSEAPDQPAIRLPDMPGRPFKGTAEKLPFKPSHGREGRARAQAMARMGEATKGGVNFTP